MNRKFRNLVTVVVVIAATLATTLPSLAQQPEAVRDDPRAPVMLRPNEKAAMLEDMREYLKGLQEIFVALAREDMNAVALRAESLGKIKIFHTYLTFPTVSGVRFRELASLVHEDFEEIATDAKANRNPKATLEKLATTMKRCVSCHESFRLNDKLHGR